MYLSLITWRSWSLTLDKITDPHLTYHFMTLSPHMVWVKTCFLLSAKKSCQNLISNSTSFVKIVLLATIDSAIVYRIFNIGETADLVQSHMMLVSLYWKMYYCFSFFPFLLLNHFDIHLQSLYVCTFSFWLRHRSTICHATGNPVSFRRLLWKRQLFWSKKVI